MGIIWYNARETSLTYCKIMLENMYALFSYLTKQDFALFLITLVEFLFCEYYKWGSKTDNPNTYAIDGKIICSKINDNRLKELIGTVCSTRNSIVHRQSIESKKMFDDLYSDRESLKQLLDFLRIQPFLHADLLFDITDMKYSEEAIKDYSLASFMKRRSLSPEECITFVRENRQKKEQNND